MDGVGSLKAPLLCGANNDESSGGVYELVNLDQNSLNSEYEWTNTTQS